ncbi:FG-GAP repeat protein [bacterium BMS3Abin03]|nr:FG-GAP repeat protein [bacterium BMS3Abin03]
MKKVYTILIVIFSLTFAIPQGNNFLPDVMNKVQVIQNVSDKLVPEIILLDTFPNFNGFPKHISGTSLEGGILVNMDSDPELEILYNVGNLVYAWNSDGTDVAGWPKTVTPTLQSAPAFGDIDGDGEGEIVVTRLSGTSNGTVYAFEKDGSNVSGFPINHGYSTRTPVLADLDGDGALEIIVNKRLYPNGEVWVYKGDGTVFPGWPQSTTEVPASSAAVGDITGDNVPEIVFESYTSIYVWDKDGNLLSGFPFILPGGYTLSYSSPVLADVDNDNKREIIFGTHNTSNGSGSVYILNDDGSVLPGWPKYTGWWVYTPPSVGYIDGDNILDIAVGDQVLSGTPVDHVYAWNANGDALSGFPIGPVKAINSQIILADIDNDNFVELITDDNGSPALYHAYNHDGTVVSGWPIELAGQTTFYQVPALGDVNRDGILDILCAATDATSYVNVNLLNTGISFFPEKIELSCFQYNERHNGVYGDIASALPVELVSFTASFEANSVLLKWQTASELNNLGFEIQRASNNGNFMTIGFVKGEGTSTSEHFYSFKDSGTKSTTYFYRLKQIDFNGTFEYSDIIEVDVNLTPTEFVLEQNFPNPFNPTTKIKFTISDLRFTILKVYDVSGNEIATLINKKLHPGTYEVTFDASKLPSGVYFYQLKAGSRFIATKKMILLR